MQYTTPHRAINLVMALCLCLAQQYSWARPELNGMAVHTELGKEQFIAALYTETLSKDFKVTVLANERKTMALKILADSIYSRRFKRMWIEGVAINAGTKELRDQADNLAEFSNILKARLKKGDLVEIVRSARKTNGVIVKLNGIELGAVKDPSFFDLLLRTWIGAVPLSSEFRTSMLGGGKIEPDLLAKYLSISASAERIAEIAFAVKKRDLNNTSLAAVSEISTSEPARPSTSDTTDQNSTNEQVAEGPSSTTQQSSSLTPAQSPVDTLAKTATAVAVAPIGTTATAELSADAPLINLEVEPEEPTNTTETDTGAETQASVAENINSPTEQPNDEVLILDLPDDILSDGIFDEDEDDFPITASSLLTEQLYISQVTRWTQKNIRYPRTAQQRNHEGTVRLSLEINRSGRLLDVDVVTGSSYRTLDRAAISAIKKASPYPEIPPEIKGETYRVTIPVTFRLQG